MTVSDHGHENVTMSLQLFISTATHTVCPPFMLLQPGHSQALQMMHLKLCLPRPSRRSRQMLCTHCDLQLSQQGAQDSNHYPCQHPCHVQLVSLGARQYSGVSKAGFWICPDEVHGIVAVRGAQQSFAKSLLLA